MENWYEFTAYNSQAMFGFGTEAEADKYCDGLNRNRDVNQYHYREMTEDEAAGLNGGDDTSGFALDLALDTQAEIAEWQAEQERKWG